MSWLICMDETFPSNNEIPRLKCIRHLRKYKRCVVAICPNSVSLAVHIYTCDLYWKWSAIRSILMGTSDDDASFLHYHSILSYLGLKNISSYVPKMVTKSKKKKYQLILSSATTTAEYETIIYIRLSALILSIETDLPWARRATRVTRQLIALITANAYVSTLGGGHFLCKHLSQAKQLAQIQMGIANGLGDVSLLGHCQVHLAYNAIQAGKFQFAHRLLWRIRKAAVKRQDTDLVSVCYAAQIYLKKTFQLHEQLKLQKRTAGQTLVDNFYRQRLA